MEKPLGWAWQWAAHTFLRGKSWICDGTRIWFMTWITPFVPTASLSTISALLFKTTEFWKGNKNSFSVEPCGRVRPMPNLFDTVSPDRPFFAANSSFSFNKLPFAFLNSHHAHKARVLLFVECVWSTPPLFAQKISAEHFSWMGHLLLMLFIYFCALEEEREPLSFFLKSWMRAELYYSVPCLFMLCYLRVGDVYGVPVERGDVGDCCQVIVQQTGTTHHMVPEDLSHRSSGNPVLDLQRKVEELRSGWAKHLNPKTHGQLTKNFWWSYLLVGRCLVRLCEVQTEWKGQGLQYLW